MKPDPAQPRKNTDKKNNRKRIKMARLTEAKLASLREEGYSSDFPSPWVGLFFGQETLEGIALTESQYSALHDAARKAGSTGVIQYLLDNLR